MNLKEQAKKDVHYLIFAGLAYLLTCIYVTYEYWIGTIDLFSVIVFIAASVLLLSAVIFGVGTVTVLQIKRLLENDKRQLWAESDARNTE